IVHTRDAEALALVADVGGDVEDDELVLGRTVSAEGRSRATVGGASAPVGALARLAVRLFTVHGQADQLRLRSTAEQRDTLDRFGGPELASVLREYRACHEERRALSVQVAELTAALEDRAAEAVRLRAELEEIAAIDPRPGEEAELQQRIELLGNLEALRAATSAAHDALESESDDPYS